MRVPSIPVNEAERLYDLAEYGVLDTAAEKVFDEIAELAAVICGTRFAAVTLVDRDRQWFKAEFGLSLGQTNRDVSICGHAIMEKDVFEVQNIAQDERFFDNPVLNGFPKIRYYAGSQLMSARGNPIGMLCVLDSEPGKLSYSQRESLSQLADVLMAVLEAARHSCLANLFGELMEGLSDDVWLADPVSLQYLHANAIALKNAGLTLKELRATTPFVLLESPNREQIEAHVAQLRNGVPFVSFEATQHPHSGNVRQLEIRCQLLVKSGRTVIVFLARELINHAEHRS